MEDKINKLNERLISLEKEKAVLESEVSSVVNSLKELGVDVTKDDINSVIKNLDEEIKNLEVKYSNILNKLEND